MDESNDRFTLPEFREYMQTSDWSCLQAPLRGGYGWIFRSIKGEIIESKYGANNDRILQENIKLLLRKILSIRTGEANPNLLIQFWRTKVIESRPYLSTSDQLFALGYLSTELCSFRMECMKHDYCIGDGAKEEKLGPIRRVFLNRHPESSPDMRLYSNREFPLIQDHFVPSDAGRYLALPLFDLHDQICLGVLEFVGCPFDFEDIVEKLEATNLRSIHINHHAGFEESCFPEKNVVDGQQVAFNEISEMVELVVKSPQLHVASIWIPCSECDHSDLKISCFELVRFSGIDLLEPSDKRIHDFIKACKFLRLQPRRGVIGRILESENMLCFCQNFCDFNIIDQPLVHYAQVARLDIYFAICLQSSHMGNNIYILEFFLSHGHPWSLCSLLSIMKQKLKSFKVASGQQLGRELISEAIEFCKGEEFTYLQSGYLDSLPLKSKTAQYGHKMEHQEHFTFDSLSSAGKNEDEEQGLTGITSLEGKTSERKRYRFDISDEDQRGMMLRKSLEEQIICITISKKLKRVRRDPDMERRPPNVMNETISSLFETKTENKSLHEFDTCQESDVVMIKEPDVVMVKAKFEDDIIKFELCVSSGLEKLQEEVAKRLKLKIGSFRLEYQDEEHDKWILLACDDDLHLRLNNLKSLGKTTVLLFVRSIPTELKLF